MTTNPATILVSCGGEDQNDSYVIRCDNLATTSPYEGCRTSPSKHLTAITDPFILTVNTVRAKRIFSTHIKGLVPKGDGTINADCECIYATPDYVLAGGEDGTLRIWRTTDGELIVKQQLFIGALTKVFLETNLWIVFAASRTGQINAWSLPELCSNCEADCLLPRSVLARHTLEVTDFAVSSNLRVFSVSHDKTVRCLDFCSPSEIFSRTLETPLSCCVLSHNEGFLYCGGCNGNIYQIQIAQNSQVIEFECGDMEISDLLISKDDRSLYSASLNHIIRKWDTATGQCVSHIVSEGTPYALTWMPETRQELPGAVEESHKKKSRRERNNQKAQKGFPRLATTIKLDREELVSAPVEDLDILSLEDELTIAIVDVCNQQKMVHGESLPEPPEEIEEEIKEQDEDRIAELERQIGILSHQLLSRGQ